MKLFKSALSLLMAVIMIFSCCSVALAATDEYDHLPQVYVTGFASANIYFVVKVIPNPGFPSGMK